MDLSSLREEIDDLDAKMVTLYEKRMQICAEIAQVKIETGKKVYDSIREKEKIVKVKQLAHNEFNQKGIEELFEQIMSMSRKLQYHLLAENGQIAKLPFLCVDQITSEDIKVVYQGSEGSYSEQAMFNYFGKDVPNIHVDTFRDAMSAIEEGAADLAVLPIENSTAGIVNEIYDLLVEYEHYIVGEIILPIKHCLIATEGTKKEDIKTVYSHPQSLMQCSRYLKRYDWTQVSMSNNAFAAKKVALRKDTTIAAIASEHAANVYGLSVLEKGINQSETNSTRFIVVTNQKTFMKNANKISVCFEIPHKSGSLYHILSHFIYNNLNMTKIESRPIEDRNWEYRFFIDFEGSLQDPSVKNALLGLREETINMRILGNY